MAKRRPATRKSAVNKRTRDGGGGRRLFTLLMLAAIVGGGYFGFNRLGLDVDQVAQQVVGIMQQSQGDTVTLYFADSKWTQLVAQQKSYTADPDPVKRIEDLVELLVEGPAQGAEPVLPAGTKLRKVYLGPDGLAVIDFEPTLDELRSYGASAEMLSVFALVHTICNNVEGINSVQILVDGREQETFAGHVRISEPLGPRSDLVDGGE